LVDLLSDISGNWYPLFPNWGANYPISSYHHAPALTWADGNLRSAQCCPSPAPSHSYQGMLMIKVVQLNWTVLKTPSLIF